MPEYKDTAGNTEHRTADDAFQVIGTLENDASATMELFSATRKAVNNWRLEVFGDEGTLVMLNDNQVLFASGDSALEEVPFLPDIVAPDDMPAIAARYYNGFNRMLDALYDSLNTGNKHPYLANFENGQTTQKVLDAIHLSSEEGIKAYI